MAIRFQGIVAMPPANWNPIAPALLRFRRYRPRIKYANLPYLVATAASKGTRLATTATRRVGTAAIRTVTSKLVTLAPQRAVPAVLQSIRAEMPRLTPAKNAMTVTLNRATVARPIAKLKMVMFVLHLDKSANSRLFAATES
jgi:hypothetical protein